MNVDEQQKQIETLTADNAKLNAAVRQSMVDYADLRQQLLDTQMQLAEAQSRISGLRAQLAVARENSD